MSEYGVYLQGSGVTIAIGWDTDFGLTGTLGLQATAPNGLSGAVSTSVSYGQGLEGVSYYVRGGTP